MTARLEVAVATKETVAPAVWAGIVVKELIVCGVPRTLKVYPMFEDVSVVVAP